MSSSTGNSDDATLLGASYAGEGFLDIPHLAMIDGLGPVKIAAKFRQTWGVPLAAVSLPVTVPDGTTLAVAGLNGLQSATGSRVRDDNGNAYDFRGLAAAFSRLGVDIYLTLDPAGQFLNMPGLQLVDSQNSTSRHVCITKTRTRRILSAILRTATDVATEACEPTGGTVRGVGVDVSNLWPMGAEDGLIEATCFCPECLESGGEIFEAVLKDSLVFGLALKDSGTGINYIDNISFGFSANDLVDLSRSRGFIDREMPVDAGLIQRAELLLAYLRRRHEIVIDSVEAIFEQAARPGAPELVRYLISENTEYDWTAGLFLRQLDQAGAAPAGVGEVWVDPSGKGVGAMRQLRTRAYLWRRARYQIDEFFSLAATLSDPGARATTGASRLSDEVARAILGDRLGRALGGSLSFPSQLVALEDASVAPGGRLGFVAVAIDDETAPNFLQGLKIAPAGRSASAPFEPN